MFQDRNTFVAKRLRPGAIHNNGGNPAKTPPNLANPHMPALTAAVATIRRGTGQIAADRR